MEQRVYSRAIEEFYGTSSVRSSNHSFAANVNDKGTDPKERGPPKCGRCRNHGEVAFVRGHSKKCRWRDCDCVKCDLNNQRRKLAQCAKQMKRLEAYKATEDNRDGDVSSPDSPASGTSAFRSTMGGPCPTNTDEVLNPLNRLLESLPKLGDKSNILACLSLVILSDSGFDVNEANRKICEGVGDLVQLIDRALDSFEDFEEEEEDEEESSESD